jgi:hypothetical protein
VDLHRREILVLIEGSLEGSAKELQMACYLSWVNPCKLLTVLGFSEKVVRTISHAKACAEMLGKQHDSLPVLRRILLSKILHGFDQHPLSFYIPGIGAALSPVAATGWIRHNGDGKNLGHDKRTPPNY